MHLWVGLGSQLYGCDICQDVCPWNRGVEKRRADTPLPAGAEPHVRLVDWLRQAIIPGRNASQLRDELANELARFREGATLRDDQAFLILHEHVMRDATIPALPTTPAFAVAEQAVPA